MCLDGLPGRKPAHVAEYQLEAFPDEPEEQQVDVLQVIPHPNDLAPACSNSHHFETSEQTHPEPKRRLTNACLNFIHLDTRNRRGNIIWHALSQTNHSPVLVLEQRLVALRLRLCEIALRAVHLGLDIILPEVRLDGHSDNVLLDNILMVKVGGVSISQLLQTTNDIVKPCVNFHHWDNSELCGHSWLS